MRHDARNTYSAARSRTERVHDPNNRLSSTDVSDLDRFGGKTQVIARRSKTPNHNNHNTSTANLNNSQRSSLSPDRRFRDSWDDRPQYHGTGSSNGSQGWSSPGNFDDHTQYQYHQISTAAYPYHPANLHGQLDPVWQGLAEQLGFQIGAL